MAENKLLTELKDIFIMAQKPNASEGDIPFEDFWSYHFLAKIRGEVGGIDIENPYLEDTGHYNGFNAGINLLMGAILKVLGKEAQ